MCNEMFKKVMDFSVAIANFSVYAVYRGSGRQSSVETHSKSPHVFVFLETFNNYNSLNILIPRTGTNVNHPQQALLNIYAVIMHDF